MALPEIVAGISLSKEVRQALEALLEVKSRTKELGQVARSPLLDRWIAEAAEAGRSFADTLTSEKPPTGEIDALFRRQVMPGI